MWMSSAGFGGLISRAWSEERDIRAETLARALHELEGTAPAVIQTNPTNDTHAERRRPFGHQEADAAETHNHHGLSAKLDRPGYRDRRSSDRQVQTAAQRQEEGERVIGGGGPLNDLAVGKDDLAFDESPETIVFDTGYASMNPS
jgi:hypothetical protein